jgi:hypothetical protein
MQHHTVQQIDRGPRTGKWIYTGGNRRIGRHAECCSEAWLEMLQTPIEQRDDSPAWDRIGHDTEAEAYAHMRSRLLEKLRLDTSFGDWSGCRAPLKNGSLCDTPPNSAPTSRLAISFTRCATSTAPERWSRRCGTAPATGQDRGELMFGILAAVAFILGAILHVARTVTPIWLDSWTLLFAGLAFGALHLLGVGTAWLRR